MLYSLHPVTFYPQEDSKIGSMQAHQVLLCRGKQHQPEKGTFPVQSAFQELPFEILSDPIRKIRVQSRNPKLITSPRAMLNFDAESFIKFFLNHFKNFFNLLCSTRQAYRKLSYLLSYYLHYNPQMLLRSRSWL
jgi:hypothetical protein